MTEDEKLEQFRLLLSDPDEGLRASAVRGLAQMSAPKAVDFLVQALDDGSPSVKIQAAVALGASDSPVAGPAIGRLMADELRSVRNAAAEALADLGDPGFALLAAGLKNENPLVRQCSAFGLAHCTRERAVGLLIAALQDSNENVRYYAANSLGDLRAEQALEPLIQALQRRSESENVLNSIADAIARIDGEKARHLLLECANHPDEAKRKWARVALEDLDTPL